MSDANAKDASADKVRGRFVLLTLQGASGLLKTWICAEDVREVYASMHATCPTWIHRAGRAGRGGDLVQERVDEVLSLLERADRVRVEGLQTLAGAVGFSQVPRFLSSLFDASASAAVKRTPRKSGGGK